MKGIVFTEFLEMVEGLFGDDVLEEIIERANLSTGGAYTVVGTYDHRELLQLVTALSETVEIPTPKLVHEFGRHLFHRFTIGYPQFFVGQNSAFSFLARLEEYIHVEVRKLYPDAELPRFEYRHAGPDRFEMTYRSTRPLADLAEGLIAACIDHFREDIELERQDTNTNSTSATRFCLLRRVPALSCTI